MNGPLHSPNPTLRAVALLEPTPVTPPNERAARALDRPALVLQTVLGAQALLLLAPLAVGLADIFMQRIPGGELAREVDVVAAAMHLRNWTWTALSLLTIVAAAAWWRAAGLVREDPAPCTPRRIVRAAAILYAVGGLSGLLARLAGSLPVRERLGADRYEPFWLDSAVTLVESLGTIGALPLYIAAILLARSLARARGDGPLDRAIARALWLLPAIDTLGPWLWSIGPDNIPILGDLDDGPGWFRWTTLFPLVAIAIQFDLIRRMRRTLREPPGSPIIDDAPMRPTITSTAARRIRAGALLILAAVGARFAAGAYLVMLAEDGGRPPFDQTLGLNALALLFAIGAVIGWRRIIDPRCLAGAPARAERLARIAGAALVMLAIVYAAGAGAILARIDGSTDLSLAEISLLYASAVGLACWWWPAAGRVILLARALDAPRLGRAAIEAFWWAPGLWLAAFINTNPQITPIDPWAMLPQATLRLAEPFDRPPIPQSIDAAVVILPASVGAVLYLSMLIRLAIAGKRAQSSDA